MSNSFVTDSNSTLNQSEDYLQVKHAYGIATWSKNPTITFISNTTLAYIIGSNFLTIDIETLKKMLITFKSKGRVEILKATSDKKHALLVDTENRNSSLLILDFNDQDRKKLKAQCFLENKVIKSVSLSNDSELIACLVTNNEDSLLKVFSFSRLFLLGDFKLITNNNQNITTEAVTFFLNDNKRLLVIGHKLIKILLYTVKGIRLIYNLDCDFYIEKYSWMNKSELIVIDKYGNLFSIEPKQNSIKHISLNSWNLEDYEDSIFSLNEKSDTIENKIEPNHKISVFKESFLVKDLVCARKGFFLSYATDPNVYFYETTPNKSYNFTLKYTLKLKKAKSHSKSDQLFNECIGNIFVNSIELNDSD
jgi:hypothetical protein